MSFDQQSLRLFCRTLNVWSVNQKDVNVRLASQKGDQFSFPCLLIWIAAITWARLFCCSAIHLVLKTSKDAHNKSWSPWICLNEPRGEYLRLWMIWFVQMTNNERFCSERFLFAETNLNALTSISCGWAFVKTERESIYFFVSSKRKNCFNCVHLQSDGFVLWYVMQSNPKCKLTIVWGLSSEHNVTSTSSQPWPV